MKDTRRAASTPETGSQVGYERKSFAEFTLPLSPIEKVVPEKLNQQRNRLFEPKNKRALEGIYTRIAYLLPPERSPLEVVRNYQDEIKSKGGKVLFECKGAECGDHGSALHGSRAAAKRRARFGARLHDRGARSS